MTGLCKKHVKVSQSGGHFYYYAEVCPQCKKGGSKMAKKKVAKKVVKKAKKVSK